MAAHGIKMDLDQMTGLIPCAAISPALQNVVSGVGRSHNLVLGLSLLHISGEPVTGLEEGRPMFVRCPDTVSYTHLDVYKRQIRRCLQILLRSSGGWQKKTCRAAPDAGAGANACFQYIRSE